MPVVVGMYQYNLIIMSMSSAKSILICTTVKEKVRWSKKVKKVITYNLFWNFFLL